MYSRGGGVYTIVYQICELLNPTNCSTAEITVNVGNCIDFTTNDCDGDGVTNGDEITDGTSPVDPCSVDVTSATVPPSATWSAADCDGDGVTNGDEIIDGTNPLNPDTDGDGVTDGMEATDGTIGTDPCSFDLSSVTLTPTAGWNALDCDGDGVTNGDEVNDGTSPVDPCSYNGGHITLPVTSGVDCGDGVEIPNGFTPDGDGINDVFEIVGIEKYPNNELIIYNRWGNVVFQTVNYQNNWSGNSISTLNIVNEELPTGTYFYIFDTKTNGVIKGYVYLRR